MVLFDYMACQLGLGRVTVRDGYETEYSLIIVTFVVVTATAGNLSCILNIH